MTADTNVLIHAFDPRDMRKQQVARAIVNALASGDGALGLQCVGEFQNVLRRKLKLPGWEAAQHARNLLATFATFPPSVTASTAALADLAVGRGSYFDRLLIYSAGEVGCTAMISEDAQGSVAIGGVEIVNPFGDTGVSERARELLNL